MYKALKTIGGIVLIAQAFYAFSIVDIESASEMSLRFTAFCELCFGLGLFLLTVGDEIIDRLDAKMKKDDRSRHSSQR